MSPSLNDFSKTEMLLNVLNTPPLRRNVVILSATSHAALRQKLEEYACMFGHDTIVGNNPQLGSFERWQSYTPEMQGKHFLRWAADTNNDCLIVLDELDDVKTAYTILNDIPQGARVAVSTRNPAVSRQLRSRFHCLDLTVSELNMVDARSLINASLESENIQIAPDHADRIVNALDRHPFSICSASTYLPKLRRVYDPNEHASVAEAFLAILEGPDYKGRKKFFDFQALWGMSIHSLYASAIKHLTGLIGGSTLDTSVQSLLLAIACVSDPKRGCSFKQFFLSIKPSDRVQLPPNYKMDPVFEEGLLHKQEKLESIIQSSLVIETSELLYMPQLWRDCVCLYECNDTEKLRYWLEQILTLCFHHSVDDASTWKLKLYVENCVRIANRYGISQQSLLSTPEQQDWLRSSLQQRSDVRAFQELLKECQEAEFIHKERPSEGNATYVRLDRRFAYLKSQHCSDAVDATLEDVTSAISRTLSAVARSAGNAVYGISPG